MAERDVEVPLEARVEELPDSEDEVMVEEAMAHVPNTMESTLPQQQASQPPAESLDEEMSRLEKERSSLLKHSRVNKLREQVERLRRGESVDTLSTSPPVVTGVNQPEAVVTTVPSVELPKNVLKPESVIEYKGKTVKEHRDYVRDVATRIRLVPGAFPTENNKITYAMQFLKGTPKDSWYGFEEKNPNHNYTFQQYCNFLLNLVEDPVNRQLNFAQQFADAKQGEKQTVQNFDTHLQYLEAQLPLFTEDQRRMNFFTKLRPILRAALTNYQNIPNDRESLVGLAARIELNMKTIDGAKTSTSDKGKGSKRSRKGEQKDNKEEDSKPKDKSQRKRKDKKKKNGKKDKGRDLSEVQCYRCEKMGHYANACPEAEDDEKTAKPEVNAVNKSGKGKPPKKKARQAPEVDSD